MDLRARLGALSERDFRLLFSSTTVSVLGDSAAGIALAFAVLDLTGSAADLGLVLAARQIMQAVLLLVGGVWADRLPRQWILFAAALVQGGAQAATAGLLLAGKASIAQLVVLQMVYGVGGGFDMPASIGVVPQTISPARLQQANALLQLSRSAISVVGPALGGVLVVTGSPGLALAFDAATFFVAALLLATIRLHGSEPRGERSGFLRELRDGWSEFRSRTWLWTTVVLFGICNFVFASYFVLGPVVAKRYLGGAGAWATVVSCFAAGSVVGGVVALRLRPARPLLASVLASSLLITQLAALALRVPVAVLAGVAAIAGIGIAVHLTLWFTVFHEQVPEQAMSRVSSYDALGSFVLIPFGYAVAGSMSALVGVATTLWGAAAISVACVAAMVALPSVRALRPMRL